MKGKNSWLKRNSPGILMSNFNTIHLSPEFIDMNGKINFKIANKSMNLYRKGNGVERIIDKIREGRKTSLEYIDF